MHFGNSDKATLKLVFLQTWLAGVELHFTSRPRPGTPASFADACHFEKLEALKLIQATTLLHSI
ncbi:hypothetical protein BGX38DRAFT_1195133 [Terfezia claveryi]|nr:hypothetical protein BGX38DRAFT_1240484 [Terfezia claveryi]KAF8445521.1 hypothetical protein BGX38DRAFT_1195133 [Terfezia claveryi]